MSIRSESAGPAIVIMVTVAPEVRQSDGNYVKRQGIGKSDDTVQKRGTGYG